MSEQIVAAQAADTPLKRVVSHLSRTNGVRIIAIGGSRGYGIGHANSDHDLILFAEKPNDFAWDDIQREMESVCDGKFEYGPRHSLATFSVNGGKFELFFRNLETVRREIEAAQAGRFRRVMHPLYPSGMISTVAISNFVYSRPIWQAGNDFAELLDKAKIYPEALRRSMMTTCLSAANLARIHALKVRVNDPVTYLSGLLAMVAANLQLVLYAVNRRYPRLDKGALKAISKFEKAPADFVQRCEQLFVLAAQRNFREALVAMNRLIVDVAALTRTP